MDSHALESHLQELLHRVKPGLQPEEPAEDGSPPPCDSAAAPHGLRSRRAWRPSTSRCLTRKGGRSHLQWPHAVRLIGSRKH